MRTRRAFAAVLIDCLLLLAAERGASRDDKPDDKAKAVETSKLDISKLPNEELLKQATAFYTKGSGDFLAAARALAGVEAQLDDASKQLANLTPPKVEPKKTEDPKGTDTANEDAAKAAVDAAKRKADFARQKHKLTQIRKELQEKVAAGVESLQSAASAFQTALVDLKPYAVELDLRFKDGTMTGGRPNYLMPDSLEKTRLGYAVEQDKFKNRLTEARNAVEVAAKLLDDDAKAVGAAEAEATEAGRSYAREQQRKEMEKKYASEKPDEMLKELNQLVQDGIGLKGTYELAYRQFNGQVAVADSLRKELTELKQPEAKIAQIARAEDVQQAVKSIEALIGYYTARAQKIEALKAKLSSLAKSGGEFEADAAVSDDHLFKLQVVAGLLDKVGAADKLPEQAGLKRLADATERAKKLASEVRAATDKAKTDLPALDKALTEAKTAGAAAAEQLASLKQTQDATLAALRFEEQLGKMPTTQVVEEFNKLRKQLAGKIAALKTEETQYSQASLAATEARAKFEALKDPVLRAAEEQGQAEKQKILAELRKEAGLDRVTPVAAIAPVTAPTDSKKPDAKTSDEKEKKPEPPPLPPLEKLTAQLTALQQQLAARVRVLDEREEKTKALLAALDDLDARTTTYSRTLSDTMLTALQLNAAAVDIKKRVGRAELETTKIPEGVTESLGVEGRKKLEADSAALLNALSQARQQRDALRKPDPQAEALKVMTKELLAVAGQRIDLLDDLKKLNADYKMAMKDRPVSEQKRLEQTAAERMDRDGGRWDWLLALDKSKHSTNLAELIETYYREVVEIEDKDEDLKKQKEKIDELIELTARERAAILKGAPLLEKELARLDAAREEESVLTRARLKPEAAEELLKAFQAKTGRVLPKPLPLGDKDRAAKVDELADELFERYVELEAAKKWNEILAGRLGTAGLTAEAGVYQDELAQLNAASGANARRNKSLTGNPPPEPGKLGTGEQTKLPAAGGEIGKTRAELNAVRTRGVQTIGIKIGIILVAAFLLPRFIMLVLRRGIGGSEDAGGSSMVLTAVGAFLKVAVWVAAIALILSVLGFDVTAIIAGLGIGGLAIGLAAQPMISDVIGAVIIFAERRFKIGDVVRLGNDEPARVVGLTWRSTALKNPDGLVVSVPNRRVTETTVQNLTRSGQTYDSLSATVTTDKDVNAVVAVIKKAMDECENLSTDHGVSVRKFTHKGTTKVVEYRFWWFLKDYESRNKTRDEVFNRIGTELAHEDMAGTEVTLA
jgi:small-conductance mechanosensitive channel